MLCNSRTSELPWGCEFHVNSNQHTVVTLYWEPSVITVGRMKAQMTVTKSARLSGGFIVAALWEIVS